MAAVRLLSVLDSCLWPLIYFSSLSGLWCSYTHTPRWVCVCVAERPRVCWSSDSFHTSVVWDLWLWLWPPSVPFTPWENTGVRGHQQEEHTHCFMHTYKHQHVLTLKHNTEVTSRNTLKQGSPTTRSWAIWNQFFIVFSLGSFYFEKRLPHSTSLSALFSCLY